MRREGSPWRGLGVVFLKELSDHLTSARMRVLEWLVVLTALAALYGAIQQIRDTTAEDPFLFLRLFTVAREPLPSFVSFLGFLVPLMAIGLGFDAVNGEHNRRTLSRILAQPIYRDALLFGKFLAGLATLAISLVALWLLVIGLGLLLLGVPPSGEEMARAAGLPGGDDRLCGRVARARDAVLDRLPLGRDRGADHARAVAVPDGDLAGAGAGDRLGHLAARSALAADDQAPTLLGSQGWRGCRPRRCSARRWWRCSIRTTRTLGPIYLSQLQGAVMGAPLPLVREHHDRLAADRRPDRRHDPAVRHRLRGVPAPGGAGVANFALIS